MRLKSLLLAATLTAMTLAISTAADNDEFKIPLGLKPVPVPADNPMTKDKVELIKKIGGESTS